MEREYAVQEVEKKWQQYWRKERSFMARDDADRPPFYVLEMFPYPSGTLHMGHARNYTIGDVFARYRWSQGHEVLHPMGWDACGLPAENAALQKGVHPKDWTYRNAAIMKAQCQRLGTSHDWSREIFSCDPTYFRHEQKMFLDFYKKGLAYRKKAYVNWDPSEQSVLANEQVLEGRGWRSGAIVEKRLLEQWFLRITDFAEELLWDLDTLEEWPESVKQMQRNWIGKSKGWVIDFVLDTGEILPVFSTRPETLYGATFCAVALDHPVLEKWCLQSPDLLALVQDFHKKGTASHLVETEEKKAVFTHHTVQHPLLPHVSLPVYAVNYVVMDYGTGAIFGCPAHDERDFTLAKTYHLPILYVIQPLSGELVSDVVYTGDGTMIHSHVLDGLSVERAREKIAQQLLDQKKGREQTGIRLKDWGIGRQRYWGVPIPMIHCPDCGVVPVPEKDLPITLPEDVTFDQPGNPLQRHSTWQHVHCPHCGSNARRETDTFDTFFESSWYFARFCDPHNEAMPFAPQKTEKWLPVRQYIGGIEHAVLHLLYARFFTKALRTCGYWSLSEPFQGLFTQGMVCHKTFRAMDGTWLFPQEVDLSKKVRICDGNPIQVGRTEKMSKSKCNVVDVTQMVDQYGADAVRLFLLSDKPPSKDMEWTTEGIEGAWRYVRRLWTLFTKNLSLIAKCMEAPPCAFSPEAMALRKQVHKTIQRVNLALAHYGLNRYIAFLRELSNMLWDFVPQQDGDTWALREALHIFVQLMAPAMPHLAEELASLLGMPPGIHLHPWPVIDPIFLQEDTVTLSVQVNGRMRGLLEVAHDISEEELKDHLYKIPALAKHLQGTWQRCIIVPGRMVSLVIVPEEKT